MELNQEMSQGWTGLGHAVGTSCNAIRVTSISQAWNEIVYYDNLILVHMLSFQLQRQKKKHKLRTSAGLRPRQLRKARNCQKVVDCQIYVANPLICGELLGWYEETEEG